MKEDGYYTKDSDGSLIHHKYKKPAIWERAISYAKYLRDKNLETITTEYFFFEFFRDHMKRDHERVYMVTVWGDAVTAAKNLKKDWGRTGSKGYDYLVKDNNIYIETTEVYLHLEFQNDGLSFELNGRDKSDNEHTGSETYTFLNWDNL